MIFEFHQQVEAEFDHLVVFQCLPTLKRKRWNLAAAVWQESPEGFFFQLREPLDCSQTDILLTKNENRRAAHN